MYNQMHLPLSRRSTLSISLATQSQTSDHACDGSPDRCWQYRQPGTKPWVRSTLTPRWWVWLKRPVCAVHWSEQWVANERKCELLQVTFCREGIACVYLLGICKHFPCFFVLTIFVPFFLTVLFFFPSVFSFSLFMSQLVCSMLYVWTSVVCMDCPSNLYVCSVECMTAPDVSFNNTCICTGQPLLYVHHSFCAQCMTTPKYMYCVLHHIDLFWYIFTATIVQRTHVFSSFWVFQMTATLPLPPSIDTGPAVPRPSSASVRAHPTCSAVRSDQRLPAMNRRDLATSESCSAGREINGRAAVNDLLHEEGVPHEP